MRLAGKVALITGGAEGIGAETARRFIAEGAKVVLGDVQLEKARALASELGAEAVELDVRSEAQWQAAVAQAVARFGKLTTLCNIAGISEPGGVTEVAPESWQRTLDINLTGTFLGCRAAIPAMVASGEACAIVNTGSMLALRPGGMFPAYVASKAGVAALTRAVALDCAGKGLPIRVNTVHPGAVRTPMLERYLNMMPGGPEQVEKMFAANHPLGRVGEAREVADAILFLASDEASFTTGSDLPVDGGGWTRE